jgi:hypothetical protein
MLILMACGTRSRLTEGDVGQAQSGPRAWTAYLQCASQRVTDGSEAHETSKAAGQ